MILIWFESGIHNNLSFYVISCRICLYIIYIYIPNIHVYGVRAHVMMLQIFKSNIAALNEFDLRLALNVIQINDLSAWSVS